jgi:hypothetical protein
VAEDEGESDATRKPADKCDIFSTCSSSLLNMSRIRVYLIGFLTTVCKRPKVLSSMSDNKVKRVERESDTYLCKDVSLAESFPCVLRSVECHCCSVMADILSRSANRLITESSKRSHVLRCWCISGWLSARH